jgi:heme o synthase
MPFYAYVQLCKLRLMAMVLATTAAGYILASGQPVDGFRLALTMLGTGLAAAGAGALNQVLEADRDARMERTRDRPLPAGRLSRGHALVFGAVIALAGLTLLNEFVNPLTASFGLANLVIYLAIYTPLKARTSLNTLVGAVCGALPPVMGWTGATNQLSSGVLLLGLVLLVWQVPHFLSLAWLYRDDYARAGYRMLPVIDPTGRFTCLMMIVYSLALLPVCLVMTLRGTAGYLFGAASLLLGLGLFLVVLGLWTTRSRENARRVFLASIVYLPLLLCALLADARRPAPGYQLQSPPTAQTAYAHPSLPVPRPE